MQNKDGFHFGIVLRAAFPAVALSSVFLFQSCDKEDPEPTNEEEVITTVKVTLVPDADGDIVRLTFSDPDGPLGDTDALITASGPLKASTTYAAAIELLNDTVSPAINVSEEVAEEGSEHLFCFDVTGNITVIREDEDENGLPLGLISSWVTGEPGAAEVVVILRHQPGTKTGACPGTGDTDVEVSFPVVIE
jgi:hypothetical protein